MNSIATVTSVLVCVILIGVLLVPVVEDFAQEEVTNTGAAEGLSLGYFQSSDDWPSAAISITADTSGASLSGDYAGTVSASDCILAVSDTAAAYLTGGKLIWYDGSTRSQTDSLTLTLDGSAHTLNGVAAQWVYLPQMGGAYGSYSGSIANQLSDVVAVGDFAGVVMISDGTEILSGNSYGLAATVGTGDGGEITGVTYAIPSTEEPATVGTGGDSAILTPDGDVEGAADPVVISPDDGDASSSVVVTPEEIDTAPAAVTAPSGSTLVGDLYYTVSGSSATVAGVSEAVSSGSTTSVTVPETVDIDGSTYAVTSIGSQAFSSCTGLTSITLPAGLTSIGKSAFSGCTGLTEILNLSSVELTPSMGVTDTVTVSDSIHSLAIVQQESAIIQQKAGAEYTIVSMLPIFAIIALLLFVAGAVYRRF